MISELKQSSLSLASLVFKDGVLVCSGEWTVYSIKNLAKRLPTLPQQVGLLKIDGSQIKEMDSAGAFALQRYIQDLAAQGWETHYSEFKEKWNSLLKLVETHMEGALMKPCEKKHATFAFKVGQETVSKGMEVVKCLDFIGRIFYSLCEHIKHPTRIQWRSVLNTVDQTGYRAMPIIALLLFLIGIVLTYQMGLQLKTYGANVFIVNLTGIAILREFSPLITAIIIAGRTSSSFTALIGTMKVYEEIDALSVMGLSSMNRLVLPRILGLMIALPLLTIWASIFGVMGSMLMANNILGINYINFLQRFAEVVDLQTFWVGMSKTPVFAIIIAVVGCYQGFQVSLSADSVGQQTTKSVVQAIFLIIVADAAFSVAYSWLGI